MFAVVTTFPVSCAIDSPESTANTMGRDFPVSRRYDSLHGEPTACREYQRAAGGIFNSMILNAPLRFVKESDYNELINLYHLARTALSGNGKDDSKYERMLWASKEFAKAHSYCSSTGAYKDLSANLCAY